MKVHHCVQAELTAISTKEGAFRRQYPQDMPEGGRHLVTDQSRELGSAVRGHRSADVVSVTSFNLVKAVKRAAGPSHVCCDAKKSSLFAADSFSGKTEGRDCAAKAAA